MLKVGKVGFFQLRLKKYSFQQKIIIGKKIKQMCKNEFSENYFCGEEAKKNLNKAVGLYETAAFKGNVFSQIRLGQLYEEQNNIEKEKTSKFKNLTNNILGKR